VLKALLFETGNIDPIIAKIKSLNDAEEFKNVRSFSLCFSTVVVGFS